MRESFSLQGFDLQAQWARQLSSFNRYTDHEPLSRHPLCDLLPSALIPVHRLSIIHEIYFKILDSSR